MFTVVELGITEPGLSILSQTYIHLLGQHFLPGPQGGEKFQLATGSKVYSGGTYFGGCKVDLKSGPYLAAVKRSLLLEFSGRLNLHVTTKQRSHGSHGSRSMPKALLCACGKPDRAED